MIATDLLGVAATAAGLYVTAFAVVRLAGRRTVSQLSAFDALVTVALGSLIAGSIVSQPPSYTRGAVAISTLVALQVVVGAARQRWPRVRNVVDFRSQTVYEHGTEKLDSSLLGAQITSDELDSAVRAAGMHSRSTVATIVLEPDGKLSVIPVR